MVCRRIMDTVRKFRSFMKKLRLIVPVLFLLTFFSCDKNCEGCDPSEFINYGLQNQCNESLTLYFYNKTRDSSLYVDTVYISSNDKMTIYSISNTTQDPVRVITCNPTKKDAYDSIQVFKNGVYTLSFFPDSCSESLPNPMCENSYVKTENTSEYGSHFTNYLLTFKQE